MTFADSDIVRFWSKVATSGADECWPWKANSTHRFGYGMFWLGGNNVGAHRVAWMVTHGDIPSGLAVCHRCDNPKCCNPAHMFLGTHAENNRDMRAKGRFTPATGERHGSATKPLSVPRGRSHWGAKLDNDRVREIRQLAASGRTHKCIGQMFGVCQSTVTLVAQRKAWAHVA